MATPRSQQAGRPSGSRFAQFKLVLLGMSSRPIRYRHLPTNLSFQVNPLSERYITINPDYKLMPEMLTLAVIEFISLTICQGKRFSCSFAAPR